MVLLCDFEMSLVQADTKKTFKEHRKPEGQVYFEVEPDEEYFIRIQRVGNTFPGPLLVRPSVDGNDLSYTVPFEAASPNPNYHGLWTKHNGIETETSLKFTKPRHVQSGRQQQQQSGLLMGKVEIEIYEGLFWGYGVVGNYSMSPWHSNESQVPAAAKKFLRTSAGTSSFTTVCNQSPVKQYTRGRMINHVRLNYCTALGLIQVGVLPSPSPEAYHRMVNQYSRAGVGSYPDRSSSSCTSPPLPIITPIRYTTPCGKTEELFDLTHLENDDE